MHKEILDALKAKFVGVSDSVLNRIATKLAKTATTAEQVKTAVEGVTIQQVIDSYADSRATEATQTAVQNYEIKHGLKDGVKVDTSGGAPQPQQTVVQPQPTPQGGAETVPVWAQALIDSNKQLTERLAAVETERTTTNRKAQLTAVIAKLPENLRKPYERITLDSLKEDEFTSLLTDITTEVDGIASSLQSKGAVFGRPAATGSTGNGTELTEEQQKLIAHRDSKPADKDGQPF